MNDEVIRKYLITDSFLRFFKFFLIFFMIFFSGTFADFYCIFHCFLVFFSDIEIGQKSYEHISFPL